MDVVRACMESGSYRHRVKDSLRGMVPKVLDVSVSGNGLASRHCIKGVVASCVNVGSGLVTVGRTRIYGWCGIFFS